MKEYDVKTPILEPIEIRLKRGQTSKPYVLCAWVSERGTILVGLSAGGYGIPEALTNLQMAPRTAIPGKAIPGWQEELLTAVETGIYDVIEIR